MSDSPLVKWLKSSGIVQSLRHRDFLLFQIGIWSVNFGMWIQRIAVGWLAWTLTESGAWLGVVAVAQALPSFALMPLGGALGDRMDRLALLRITQIIAVILAIGVSALVYFDAMNIWLLLVFVVVFGSNTTLALPARMSVAPALVPKADLPAAIAVNSIGYSIATFIGPAAAGLLISHGGISLAFIVHATLYLPMLFILGAITLQRSESRTRPGQSLFGDVVEGVRYVAGHSGIGPVLLLLFLCSILSRSMTDLLPGFADAVFKRGPEGLAALASVFGIGGVVASFWLANRNRITGTTRIFLSGLAIVGAAQFLFAVGDSYHIALGCMVAMGLANGMFMNSGQILIQTAVEGSMRSRVLSLYTLSYRAGPSIGTLAMGSLATLFGFELPVAVAAGLLLLCWIAILPRGGRMAARLETLPDAGDGADSIPAPAARPTTSQ